MGFWRIQEKSKQLRVRTQVKKREYKAIRQVLDALVEEHDDWLI